MKKKLVLFALTAIMTLGSTFTVLAAPSCPTPTPAPCEPAKPQGKTDEQRAEEKKQVEAMYAGFRDFYEFHPVEWNNIGQLYAINPGLGLDAALTTAANITIDEYNAQMAAYFAQYAEQMALYEAMMNAQ